MNNIQTYQLELNNFHIVEHNGRRVLLHVPSGGLFESDEVSENLITELSEKNRFTLEDILNNSKDSSNKKNVGDRFSEFVSLDIIKPVGIPAVKPKVEIEDFPLNTIVLNVNTGCNLSCTYCYKEDLDTPSNGRKMTFETAKESIDLLVNESSGQEKLNVIFFGGEPLSNLKLIKKVIDYCDSQTTKKLNFDYSLTTNATLLNDETIEFLRANNVGVSVSIDGPKAVHDRRRITVGGQGTYHVVVEKSKKLLARHNSRPIGARVTLTKGYTNVVDIHNHLINDIGFSEVGFAPVTAGDVATFNLSDQELRDVFDSMKELGLLYLENALKDVNIGFSNMHQLMTDLYEGRKKSVPCGAGLGLLAVDHKGGLNLCHRFTGSDLETFGSVSEGIAKKELGEFIKKATDFEGKGCEQCHIRSLCAGGCYHESYSHFGDPHSPTYNYCDLLREWIDFGIKVYLDILEKNPAFLKKYIATRGK
ncbi:MAG: quinohemoprotein amine dehydrogenase maturation protein [Neptuniibacter sp.]